MNSLPWIKLDVALPRHPKSQVLAALLRTPRAWSHMAEAWMWAAEHAPSGRIDGQHADVVLESAAGWTGEPGAFVDAAAEAGFVDRLKEGIVLHGWKERHEAHAKHLERERDRWRRRRANSGASTREPAPNSTGSPHGARAEPAATPRGVGSRSANSGGTPRSLRAELGGKDPEILRSEKKQEGSPPPTPPKASATSSGSKEEEALKFFSWAQEARCKALGYDRPEKPPKKLAAWMEEAFSEKGVTLDRLEGAWLRYLRKEDSWARSKCCAFALFASGDVWRNRLPDEEPEGQRCAVPGCGKEAGERMGAWGGACCPAHFDAWKRTKKPSAEAWKAFLSEVAA